jgi:hypothetical protein
MEQKEHKDINVKGALVTIATIDLVLVGLLLLKLLMMS